jgi:hypothetical protein
MEQDDKINVEEIMGQLFCPKHFQCCMSGFKDLCWATDIGLESYLKCLEEDPGACKFSSSFAGTYLCECPLRIYIARKLKK